MYGNFITLTNISDSDINKITRYKIEPLHVSLHSFDKEIRNLIFGNEKNARGLKNLKILDDNRIKMNIQIVLCPSVNDGNDLENTLDILINNYQAVRSTAIVPVGITKFCKKSLLKPFNKKSASEVINFINRYKKLNAKNKNASKIYLSDEFYLIAEKELPPVKYYGRLYQVKNGIGKAADFLEQFSRASIKYLEKKEQYRFERENILIVTSEYGKGIIAQALKLPGGFINKHAAEKINGSLPKKKIDVLAVKNMFLGGNVKVTGLLTGSDIIKQLEKINMDIYDRILAPECIFNPDGLTIDNYSRDTIIKYGGGRISVIAEDGKSLARNLA